MSPEPLNEDDCRRLFRSVVQEWFLERLDTRLGTKDVIPLVRYHVACSGGCGPTPDGPYSDGGNPVYWSLQHATVSGGVEGRVEYTERATGQRTVVREGRLSWSNLANRSTLAALELRRERSAEPLPGEQLTLA